MRWMRAFAGVFGMVMAMQSPALAAAPAELRSPQALHALMVLPQSSDSPARIVAMDQRRGYYEGWTQHWRKGAGYRIGDVSLIEGFASRVETEWLTRSAAAQEHIHPHGHEARYPQARESLWLHRGDMALTLVVQSQKAQHLGLMPLWGISAGRPELQHGRQSLWLVRLPEQTDQRVPTVVAISANRPLHWIAAARAELPTILQQAARSQHVAMTREPRNELQLHLVFDRDAEAALRRARDLAAQDIPAVLQQAAWRDLSKGWLWTPDRAFNRALLWAQWSALGFHVNEFGPGIWAGLPWFRDNWGRDTFIALPGTLLTSGQFDAAQQVIDAFVARQRTGDPQDPDDGRIPNRVAANTETLYNTVDGTPWMILAAWRLAQHSGRWDRLQTLRPMMARYVDGAQRHHLDAAGLLTHDDADTWMDARIEGRDAWSPRGNRAVEVQALWYAALQIAARTEQHAGDLTRAARYIDLAARLRAAFRGKFWNGRQLADRIDADDVADFRWRPNALLAMSLQAEDLGLATLLSAAEQARVAADTLRHLAYPWGLASLDPEHPDFHPRHVNEAFHHKDAAYHNGTVWLWNSGFAVSVLSRLGALDEAAKLMRGLAQQVLLLDPPGTLSELVDAWPDSHGLVRPSGTFSQSWSVAEFTRAAFADVLGFQPQLLTDALLFRPALPEQWQTIDANLPIGARGALRVALQRRDGGQFWRFQATQHWASPLRLRLELLDASGARQRLQVLWHGQPLQVDWAAGVAKVNAEQWPVERVQESQRSAFGDTQWLAPPHYQDGLHPVTRGENVLRNRILGEH